MVRYARRKKTSRVLKLRYDNPMAKKTTPKPRKPVHHRKHHHTHAELVELVIALETQIMALSTAVSAKFDENDQKLTDLSHKVDDFIAAGGSTANDAEVIARLTKQAQSVDAIAAKLTPVP